MPPETRTNDEIMADIVARAAAQVRDDLKPADDAPAFTEAQETRFRELFAGLLAETPDDHPFVRKMKFSGPESKLVGSKFARWNLAVEDVEFLFDLQTSLIGQRHVDNSGVYTGPSDELQQAFAAISEAVYIPQDEIRKIDQQALDGIFPRVPKAGSQRQSRAQAQRAMDTAESGFGQQLVGAQYVAALWEEARPQSMIFGLLDDFEMTAPTAYLPVEVDIPELLFVSESTANNSANYATVKTGSNRVQVDAKKFVVHQMWSGELEEDSIIPFIPFLRRQLALGIAHYSDSLVLNGDTTNAATGNINLDDADPADTKHYLAFDGIRHASLVDNTDNVKDMGGAGVSVNMFRDLRGMLLDPARVVDWGHPASADDLVFITDPETADRVQLLDEVLNWKLYNNQGSILNGEQGRILGHAVISSMAMPKTEADGKVSTTASNNIYGQIVALNRRGVKVGWRRRIRTETERLPGSDQTRIISSMRLGLGRFTPTANVNAIEWTSAAIEIGL